MDQQRQETLTVSFIDFDDDDECVNLAAERSKPTQQCYLSALLLNLSADTKLDEVHTTHQGISIADCLYLFCATEASVLSLSSSLSWLKLNAYGVLQ